LICSGIGAQAARRATEAIIQATQPWRVISVGFAGALDPAAKVADVLEPRIVVNAADGSRVEMPSGKGTLVSYVAVADRDQKQRLANSYTAAAVDMEAASVAQGAQVHGVEFAALKAISDVFDFVMPPVEKFVASDGQFRSAGFAVHVAMRPWLWGRTVVLARNGARASRALCATIQSYLEREALAAVAG
jgi:adenosylhomocysteine nucleosidase